MKYNDDCSNKLKNYIAFTACSDIDQICRPLKEKLNIAMFCYHRIFNDGSEIMLSNNIAWAENFYNKGYFMGGDSTRAIGQDKFRHTIWPFENNLNILYDARNICKIFHGITLRTNEVDYYELFGFGTKSNNILAINLFLNNIDFLEKFSLHFKNKLSSLITKCMKNKIILPDMPYIANKNIDLFEMKENINFIEIPNKNSLLDKSKFSNRELECIKHLIIGKTMRETAETLFISPRTVETHVDNIKNKLGCHKKSELIGRLIDIGFSRSF